MPRRLFAFALMLFTLPLFSQELALEGEIMLHSRHAWRGEPLGTAVSFEPSLTAVMGNFSFNIWAAVTPDNSYSEIDLIPSYQFKYFTLTLLDYYNPVAEEKNRYLDFSKEENRHSVEITLDNESVEKQRLKYLLATFFLGDKNKETGKPFYSTYIEFSYPFPVIGIEAKPFVGGTPFRGYYADHLAVINSGIRFEKVLDFKMPFSIPLSLSLIANPYCKNTFVTFATGIAF